jgi:hypothetical protein
MNVGSTQEAAGSKLVLDGSALDQAGEIHMGGVAEGQQEALVLVPEKRDSAADQGPDGLLFAAIGAAVAGVVIGRVVHNHRQRR